MSPLPAAPPGSRTASDVLARGLVVFAVAVVAVACATPVLWTVGVVVGNPVVLRDLPPSSFRLVLLARTVLYDGVVAMVATALALPAALVIGRGRGPLAAVVRWLVAAALFLPPLSLAYGWLQVERWIEPSLRPLGVSFAPGTTADVLRCLWTLAAWLWAVPACLLGLALRRSDPAVELLAELDGVKGRMRLRQLRGALLASLVAVFLLASQQATVFRPGGIPVVASEVEVVFATGAFSALPSGGELGRVAPAQPERAAAAVATALPLLLVTVLLVLLAWFARSEGTAADLAVGRWPPVLDASRGIELLAVVVLVLTVGVPILGLLLSVRSPASFTAAEVTEHLPAATLGSLLLGGAAAVVAALLALAASLRRLPGLLPLAALSFLLGGQLLAIALIRVCNRPGLLWAYHSWPLPVLAYVGRFGWVALAAALLTWTRPWRTLRDMARTDRASPARIAVAVVWPLAWPWISFAGIVVGTLTLTEVPATAILAPQDPPVLTSLLTVWGHHLRSDPMLVASLWMVAVVLVPLAVAGVLAAVGTRRARRLEDAEPR